MAITRRGLSRGLSLYLIISFVVLVVLIGFTATSETWAEITKIRLAYLPPLLLMVALRWVLDGLSVRVLIKGVGREITLRKAIELRVASLFVFAVTPHPIGANSFQTYFLYRENIPVGEGLGILTLRGILPIFAFLLVIPVSLLRIQEMGVHHFRTLAQVVAVPTVAFIIIFLVALRRPQGIKAFAFLLIRLLCKARVINEGKIGGLHQWVNQEVDSLTQILRLYLRRKRVVLCSTLCIILFFLVHFTVALFVLWAFGFFPPLARVFAFQLALTPLLYFSPTPGGSGVNELGYAAFFASFLPTHLVGVSVVLWRFSSAYLGMVVGGILLLRRFGGFLKAQGAIQAKVP